MLKLLETSFENGRRQGKADSNKEFLRGYEAGYANGKESTGKTLEKLREALYGVLE